MLVVSPGLLAGLVRLLSRLIKNVNCQPSTGQPTPYL